MTTETAFVDVDTQIDFLFPAGSLYVPGAEALVPVFAKLNQYAAARGIPLISTIDAHAENDAEFTEYAPHCIAGTVGQGKPGGTLLERRAVVTMNPKEAIEIGGVQQVIVEKTSVDVFRNKNFPRLLSAVNAARYVVYGVVTEICVRHAVMGLLRTGARVALVEDAVRHLKEPIARQMLTGFKAAGGTVTRVSDILDRSE
jgi:nicotinamidase/pyrazinamidase